MCATFLINISEDEIREILREIEEKYADVECGTGNVYKKSIVPALTLHGNEILAQPMFWGIPLYKNKTIKDYNINARAENIGRYPMFKQLKPVVIPTSGFYEWGTPSGYHKKTKFIFTQSDSNVTYLAGLYGEYEVADGFYPHRFTIVTTLPNEIVGQVHSRMPVVLDKSEIHGWLGGVERSSFLERSGVMLNMDSA